MLDVTNPFGTNALNDPPVTVQCHGVGASAAPNQCWATRFPARVSLLNNTIHLTTTVLSHLWLCRVGRAQPRGGTLVTGVG